MGGPLGGGWAPNLSLLSSILSPLAKRMTQRDLAGSIEGKPFPIYVIVAQLVEAMV